VPNGHGMTPVDGQKYCPKHVEFRTRINSEISASVGFYCKEEINNYQFINCVHVFIISP
jgi:hypothetical protein